LAKAVTPGHWSACGLLRRASALAGICAGLSGCGSSDGSGLYGDGFLPVEPPDAGAPSGATLDDPGSVVALRFAAPALDSLNAQLSAARARDATALRDLHQVPFSAGLDYSAVSAQGLERIQDSTLALTTSEMAALGQRGFVIVPRREYPSFPYAYAEIYLQDLPVFVSADMILESVHRSYNAMLSEIESLVLAPRLSALLARLRARLGSGGVAMSATLAADLDLFLSVGERLLGAANVTPVRGADPQQIAALISAAEAAGGAREVSLFGSTRELDFSQFEPRGHYADDPTLRSYFRAMIWFGRTDLRLIETLGTGERVFRRRQLEAALGLRELMDADSLADWTAIDQAIGAFVGEHDYMTLLELPDLLAALGVADSSGLADLPDARVAQAIVDGRFGNQRILSQIVIKDPSASGTLPLDSSFALFGQRYVIDSHVLSNLVYDRLPERILPNSLDVAFAALGNDQALALLGGELDQAEYPGQLSALRTLVNSHQVEYWNGSLYTGWLSALRTLAPGAPGNSMSDPGVPSVARTELWGRRLLNTQLGSWAQLRHDTIAYVKQSYTTSSQCEYPDAYVDPYPEFYRALARYADRGQRTLDALALGSDQANLRARLQGYFEALSSVMGRLGSMAEAERTGAAHSAEDIAFINQAIQLLPGCGTPIGHTGWYSQLFLESDNGLQEAPTIADVHTDPGGQLPVQRAPSVLHVGTGRPRLIVTTVDSCTGPRAYAGAVFDYQEHLNPGLQRFTDEEFSALVRQQVRWEPAWMEATVVTE
jgi:hypothetical protein